MQHLSTPYYKALDLVLIICSCSIAYWFRFDSLSLPLDYFLPTTVFAISASFCLSISSFYRSTNSESSISQIYSAAYGLVIAVAVTTTCLYFSKTGDVFSRIWFTNSVFLTWVSIISARYFFKQILKISNSGNTIIILGSDPTSESTYNKLLSLKGHIKVAGKFAIEETNVENSFNTVVSFIEDYRKKHDQISAINEVWISHSVFKLISSIQLEHFFENSSIDIVYIPELPLEIENKKQSIDIVYGIPVINSNFSVSIKRKQLLKLVEDQVIAWLSLIALSPLLLITCILIKLDSKGPIIYKQERYGVGGKKIRVLKFRTMHTTESTDAFKQATENDPRITKIGRILRKTSIDELPQIVNVITGSMSIVGPRPQPVNLNEQYREKITYFMKRHNVKPGITGLAQISGARGETATIDDMSTRVDFDLEYIKKWNLLLDIKIIYRTIFAVINGTGS